MPTVQLSDGRSVEFPDGMSQDAMAAALRKLPTPQSEQQDVDLAAQGWGAGVNPLKAGASLASGVRHGISGNLGNYLDAYTMGPMHYLMGREPTMGAGIDRALREAKGQDAQLAQEHPVANTVGTIAGSAALGGLAAGPTAWRGAASGGARLLEAGRYLAANAGLGAATGALEGDTLAERGRNAALGGAIGAAGAAVVPAVVGGTQALYNTGKGLVNTGRQVFTEPGRQGIAGQVLRDATGGQVLPEVATAPIPGLVPTASQATQNPQIAAIANVLKVDENALPGQTQALAQALIGKPGGNPEALVNAASSQGTEALGAARDAMASRGRALWTTEELARPLGVSRDELVAAANNAVPNASVEVQGEINRALREVADNPTIQQANQLRSALLELKRTGEASSEVSGKRIAQEAGAAADAVLAQIEGSPTLAGRAANTGVPRVSPTTGNQFYRADGTPLIDGAQHAIPPDPAAQAAYTSARAYTREQAQLTQQLGKRYPQVAALMRGDETVNPDRVFKSLFDMHGGSGTGPQRVQELQDFLYRIGTPEANAAADQLAHAAQRFVRNAIYDQGRRGSGLNVNGQEILNPETMAEAIRVARQWVPKNQMTAPIAGDLDRVEQAANLVASPNRMRGFNNSATYERGNTKQLIENLIAQHGGQAVLAPLGAVAGYQYGPTGNPVLDAAAGAAAASMLGPRASSFAGGRLLASATGSGVTRGVEAQLAEALMNYRALHKAMSTPLYDIPPALRQSLLSRALMDAGRVATPALVATQQ